MRCMKFIFKLYLLLFAISTIYAIFTLDDLYHKVTKYKDTEDVILGLIYDVFINENRDVKILMTLTSPNCPVAEVLPQEVYEKIGSIDEINEVEVELTFDPPWGQEMMSEEAKLEFGFL